MNVLHPADGAILPIANFVRFDGSSGLDVTQVRMVADGNIEIGLVSPSEGRWTFVRKFSKPGVRRITAVGLDDDGIELERFEMTIDLRISNHFGYTPPEATLDHLGNIADLLEISEPIDKSFSALDNVAGIFKLPGDILYFESNLDLDTDGERSAGITYESTHRDETSLQFANGDSMNANKIPFFVLPGLHNGVRDDQMTLGGIVITLGDIGAVLFEDKIEFAVFGDFGPRGKIGEGSIALHRALGREKIRSNGTIRDVDIERHVVTLVFPGSGDGTPQSPDAIRDEGRRLFIELGGNLD